MKRSAWLLAGEPVLNGVRRILVEQLEHARKALEPPLSDENVHAIRKHLKRARASLRLLRDALGVAEYQRLNRAIRDAARPLTSVRDAKVLLQALENVVEKAAKSSRPSVFNALRHSLRQELRVDRAQLNAAEIAAIRSHLDTATQSLQNLSYSRLGQADIEVAIKRAHKKARKAFKTAKREPNDENLHEWRKQVKYEFNQLELLLSLKPKRIGAFVGQAYKLSDHLGDDHDLAILHERIIAQSKAAVPAANADVLLKTIKSRRAKLQDKAHRKGKLLYADKSKCKLAKALQFAHRAKNKV